MEGGGGVDDESVEMIVEMVDASSLNKWLQRIPAT